MEKIESIIEINRLEIGEANFSDQINVLRVVIITHDFSGFSGYQVVALEIANYYAERGHNVTIRAERHSQLLIPHLHKNVTISNNRVDICDFDLVWDMQGHFALNTSDLEKLRLWKGSFMSLHLSGSTPAETFHHYFSARFSNCRVFNCEEALELLESGLKTNGKSYNLKNAAPRKFHNNATRITKKLQKLLVVSNHLPFELDQALKILRDLSVDVRHIGIGSDYKLIEPNDILEADAVVTIGKTVQYALCSARPVYCYDHFGGPGWLSDKNFPLAEFKNFSGRCHPVKKSSNKIADDLIDGFLDANEFVTKNWFNFSESYDLERFLDQFLTGAQGNLFNNDECLKQIDLMRGILLHTAWIWEDVFSSRLLETLKANEKQFVILSHAVSERDSEIANFNQALAERDRAFHEIVASRSWSITRPFRVGRKVVLHCYWWLRSIITNPYLVLRTIYQKLPFLIGIRMRLRYFLNAARTKITRLVNSKQNLKALQSLTERRFDYVPVLLASNVQLLADVSIVTYNSSKWIDGFFASLTEQDYPLQKLNLCFVDNGSSDGTIEGLQRWKTQLGAELAGFEIIRGENVGFGLGHDRAIKTGDSEFVLISNIDIIFARDSITKALAAACADHLKCVASWELRQTPYEHPKYYDPVTHETNWSSHACILMRRSAYTKVGGYEHEIFMYGEDVELSYRFRSHGYQLKYCPSAVVSHYTYEHENQVKPIQFAGSTLANAYLRLRYGDFGDKIGVLLLQTILLFRPEVYKGSRGDLITNIGKILRKAPHFLSLKGPSQSASYPFRGFDYEMTRDGAFWSVGEPLAETPLVSIVTRTYRNRNEFLRQAILSVFNQTYPNLELVVVEDGGETMKEVVAKFPSIKGRQIRFFGMDKVGRSVAGNYGLKMAAGTYCMFLDDDDLLFSDHIEVLVGALAKNRESVGAYSLAMEVATNIGDNGCYTEVSHETPSYFKHEYSYDILLDHNFIPIQSLLFQRSLYLQRGGFETDMSNLEDWNLWLRYGYGNTFTYVPKTTSLFRTPAGPKVRIKRHESLHEAYFLAKNRAIKSCEGYSLLSPTL